MFGTAKDTSFSMDNSPFGTAKDSAYPSESSSQPDFGFKKPGVDQESPANTAEDFGIPGINRYTGNASSESENSFKMPETEQRPPFISEPQSYNFV